MKLVPLNTIFNIKYGNQFDFNKMDTSIKEINFVSRTRINLGVVTKVAKYRNVEPYPSGLITVTLGGTYLLSSFIQQDSFYTAQNIKVLTPIKEMTLNEKIFYCAVISKNRFRYTSHGREANITLDTLLVPDKMPTDWVNYKYEEYEINNKAISNNKLHLDLNNWKKFNLTQLFDITASKDELIDDLTEGGNTPYVTSSDNNNGVTSYVEESPTNKAGTITANRGGSVGYFFYQSIPYKSTPVDVRILTPKFEINEFTGLFIKTVLQLEKYRFNYSRKMGSDRLKNLIISLPEKNGKPDYEYMEKFIKSLPYSSNLR